MICSSKTRQRYGSTDSSLGVERNPENPGSLKKNEDFQEKGSRGPTRAKQDSHFSDIQMVEHPSVSYFTAEVRGRLSKGS